MGFFADPKSSMLIPGIGNFLKSGDFYPGDRGFFQILGFFQIWGFFKSGNFYPVDRGFLSRGLGIFSESSWDFLKSEDFFKSGDFFKFGDFYPEDRGFFYPGDQEFFIPGIFRDGDFSGMPPVTGNYQIHHH